MLCPCADASDMEEHLFVIFACNPIGKVNAITVVMTQIILVLRGRS
jgi:hypothetical protein